VVDKDLDKNILYVAQGDKHPALYSNALYATDINWISGQPPKEPFSCKAKFRYRQSDQGVYVTDIEGDKCRVVFDQPQRAVTPGQFVVFYQGDVCLGGGIIQKVYKEK
jgi:tRNA-specific 2-thiouridylase